MRDEDDHVRATNVSSERQAGYDGQTAPLPVGHQTKRSSGYTRQQSTDITRIRIADQYLSHIFGNFVCEPLGHVGAYPEGLPFYIDDDHPRISN